MIDGDAKYILWNFAEVNLGLTSVWQSCQSQLSHQVLSEMYITIMIPRAMNAFAGAV